HRDLEVPPDHATQSFRIQTCFAQHPATDRDDQSRLLRERNEVERRDFAALGMLPAQKGLDADDLRRIEADNRLERKRELLGGECLPQLRNSLEAFESRT